MTRNENGSWRGGSCSVTVTAAPGRNVSAVLTGITAVVNGRRISLPDRTYTAPVRRYNLPQNYLTVNGPSALRYGQTAELQITGASSIEGIAAHVQMQGLEVLSVSSGFCSPGEMVLLPEFGLSSVIYTCRVTARPGQTARVRLAPVEIGAGDMTLPAPDVNWQAVVSS